MRIKIQMTLFFCAFLLSVWMNGQAGIQETLPSWHWAYETIDQLNLKGFLTGLNALNRPYTRGEVAKELISLIKDGKQEKSGTSSLDRGMIRMLGGEFSPEIEEIGKRDQDSVEMRVGLRLQENLDSPSGKVTQFKGIFRSKMALSMGKRVTIYNSMVMDQYNLTDTLYSGEKWRGYVNYTEQAYVTVGMYRIRIKFGRDFLKWGTGGSGTLIFSDQCRPLDQLNLKIRYGFLEYQYIASALDSWMTNVGHQDSLGILTIRRYLSAHRVDARFFKDRLRVGVSELVFYGGRNRPVEWQYLNPFQSYHAETTNDQDEANTMGSVDVRLLAGRGAECYGSLLIDDIQIEKTVPGDLEPNEIGWLLGARIGDPVLTSGTSLLCEYVKITNRTYQAKNSWEAVIHRRVPLGYPLGNDFDRMELGLTQWLGAGAWVKVSHEIVRKGEGDIFSEWGEPWMQRTLEQGYHEPFPTGVVEKRTGWNATARFYPNRRIGLEADFRATHYRNAGHVQGKSDNETEWRIGAWFSMDALIPGGP